MSSSVAVELAVQDTAGVEIAQRVGADRVELCQALAVGGLTPSRGLIEQATDIGLPVHVLIRPRPGTFEFDRGERSVMLRDIEGAVDAGAAGVVVGALDGDRIDRDFLTDAVRAAGATTVTFHRAIDVLPAVDDAITCLVDVGVRRVLTSGGASAARDGIARLTQMVRLADGQVEVMAGGGVTVASLPTLLGTGIDAVHASAKTVVRREMPISLGGAHTPGDGDYDATDEALAEAIVNAVRADPAGNAR